MTVAFIALYYWSDSSQINEQVQYYNEKIEAANIVSKAMDVLKYHRLPNFAEDSNEKKEINPLIFTMLGEKDSPITTDEGKIEDKITVLNPNFAAVIIDMMVKTELKEGDTIAVLLTGSMPGANLAVYAAARSLKLHPVIITSVGSSWWGANSPDFTWLDMEQVLVQEGIFNVRSSAASIGGSDDNGGLRLSDQGRDMIIEAIDRNEITIIQQRTLSENIKARLEIFRRIMPLSSYKAVINIGGGIASIGHRQNNNLIPNGVNIHLPVKNYPNRGCVHFFADEDVPIIHIGDVKKIARKYGLPIAQLPLPEIGVGKVYIQPKYNLTTATIAFLLMFIILVVVKYFDHKSYKWREEKVDTDTIV